MAELHLNRFGNGTRGKSINYKDEWMTPQEFENHSQINSALKSLHNIQCEILNQSKMPETIRSLVNSGKLKLHSKKCLCSICRKEKKYQVEEGRFCTICQDFEVRIGHESMQCQCPNIVCLKCGQKGHTKIHCLFETEILPLPDQIFLKIIGYLDVIDTIHCSQVSKRLQKICMDKSLNLFQRSFTFPVPAINGKTILEVNRKVMKICLIF